MAEHAVGPLDDQQVGVRTARSVKRHMGDHGWRFPDSGSIEGKRYAETYLGEGVSDAVITVPACTALYERSRTEDAGGSRTPGDSGGPDEEVVDAEIVDDDKAGAG